MKTSEKLSKVRYQLMRNKPFYATIDLKMNRVFGRFPFIMGTDAKNIYINPELCEQRTYRDLFFIYIHELKHIILLHSKLSAKFPKLDKFILNIAEDILINQLNYEELGYVPSDAFTKDNFPELKEIDIKKLTSIEIYRIIRNRFKKIIEKLPQDIFGPSKSRSDSGAGSSLPSKDKGTEKDTGIFEEIKRKYDKLKEELEKMKEITDEDKMIIEKAFWDYQFNEIIDNLPTEQKEKLIEEIKDTIMRSYVLHKDRGVIPASLENLIEHMFKKVRNWKNILREEILNAEKEDFTWRKISDTLQALHSAGFTQIGNLPSLDDTPAVSPFVIGIDVSGSIGDDEYKMFLDEIYSIFKTTKVQEFDIVMWEAEVKKVFRGRNGFRETDIWEFLKKRKGYGGTVLKSFIQWCDKNARNKIGIIFTDAFTENNLTIQDFKNFKRVIFVLTPDANYENVQKLKCNKIKIIQMTKNSEF